MPRRKLWSHKIKTVSTYPPEGTFTKDARTMASKKVSPKGINSGIRMIQFFINRAGKKLPLERRRELEMAKRILQEKLAKQKRADNLVLYLWKAFWSNIWVMIRGNR